MACRSCGERRALTVQAVSNIRRGDLQAARSNVQQFGQTIRTDLRSIKSVLTQRPPRTR